MSRLTIVLVLVGATIGYLIILPIGILLFTTFKSTGITLPFDPNIPFTLSNYLSVFSSPRTYQVLWNTLVYSCGSLSISFPLAVVFAWIIERTDVPFRRLLRVLILSPLAVTPLILAIAWVLLLNPVSGYINLVIRSVLGIGGIGPLNIGSFAGLIWVTGLSMVPTIYLGIAGTVSSMDRTLEEASAVSGARGPSTFFRITLRILWPGLASMLIYFFAIVFQFWDVPAIIGLPSRIYVLSTYIFNAMEPPAGLPDYGRATTYAVISLAISAVLIVLYARLSRHQERIQMVGEKGFRSARVGLGRYRYLAVSGLVVYFLVGVALPLATVFWTSLLPYLSLIGNARLTLANYLGLLSYPGMAKAFVNTAIIAVTSATATVSLAFVTSWLSIRKKYSLPEHMTFLLVGVPGIALGTALAFTYIFLPFGIYGTIWIIIIADATLFLPFSVRSTNAGLLQLRSEMEEASLVLGASNPTTLARITGPILSSSILKTWIWVVVHSMKEAPVAVLLYTYGNQTLAVLLYLIWNGGTNIGIASSLSIVMALISASLAIVLMWAEDLSSLTKQVSR